jgi:hypothetical protein
MRGTKVPLGPLLFVWATPDKGIIWKANTGAGSLMTSSKRPRWTDEVN